MRIKKVILFVLAIILLCSFASAGSLKEYNEFHKVSHSYDDIDINDVNVTNGANSTINGTLLGGVNTSYVGKINQSIRIGGAGQAVDTNFGGMYTNDTFTLNCWIKSNHTVEVRFGARDAATDYAYFFRLDESGDDVLGTISYDGANVVAAYAEGVNWNDDTWNMITVVRNGSTETDVQLYSNGSLQTVDSVSAGTLVSDLIDVDIYFGASNQAGVITNPMTGQLDQCDLWVGTALSEENVTWLFNSDVGRTTADIRGEGGAPAPVAGTNFSITVTNQNTFNVTVNGTTYTTVTGKIETTMGNADGGEYNITIEAINYFNRTFIDYNITTNISTAISQYPLITSYNEWNGSQVLTYNISLLGNTYSTIDGDIYFPFNGTHMVQIESPDYNVINDTLNVSKNDNFNTTNIYQSIINIFAREIITAEFIAPFSIWTVNGEYTTTNSTIQLYPNKGTYIWNWTTDSNFFNKTDESFAITLDYHNFTVSNVFARNITFINNDTLAAITPSCIQGNETYTLPYLMPNSSVVLECSLAGYDDKNITLAGMPDSTVYNMSGATPTPTPDETEYVLMRDGMLYVLLAFGTFVIIVAATIILLFVTGVSIDLLGLAGTVMVLAVGTGILMAIISVILNIFG